VFILSSVKYLVVCVDSK